jgi:transcriptional regulator with XRE-family HTH domain
VIDGDRVRWLRYHHGILFYELAESARISRTTLWEIESGVRKNPRAPVMSRLARALGVVPAELAPRPVPERAAMVAESRYADIQTVAELEALLNKFRARWLAEAKEETACPRS